MRSKHAFAYSKAWTTHIPMLIKTVQHTKGPVLELGVGFASTPLLHWLCKEENRPLLSLESVQHWYEFARKFQSGTHRIRFVEDWKTYPIDTKKLWSVVFIDHVTDERVNDAIRLKDSAEYIVIHDTEDTRHYGYERMWEHFKYIYHWKGCSPWTSVVSNIRDVSWLN